MSDQRGIVQLMPWQREVAGLVNAVPTLNTLLLAGGRGGGKSVLLTWLIGYFALTTGDKFNAVLIRHDLAGLAKLEDMLLQQMPVLLPKSRYLKAKRAWELSNGGKIRLIHMDGNDGFAKIQGEDLSHVFWDELTQESDPQVVLRVRSSMRTTDPSVRPKFISTCNPLGPGSWWVRDYLVSKSLPNKIWRCEFFGGQETCWVKSTLRDNNYLDQDTYESELRASCFGDESKIAAEVYGDWGQVTAGFFGSCLSVERSMISGNFVIPQLQDSDRVFREESRARNCWVGGDWGTASPACAILIYEVQEDMEFEGKFIARGSWVCVDEEYVCSIQTDGSREWNRGDRSLTVPKFVDRIKRLYSRNGFVLQSIHPKRVIMDSAVTASLGFGGYADPVTLSSEFERYGWKVTGSPKSSRAVGWQFFKTLLSQAGTNEPGLYISEKCESLWATLPYCVSDDKNPEDMEISAPDHAADAVRYCLTASRQKRHTYKAGFVKLGVSAF